MTWAFLFLVVATFCFAVGALLVVLDEADLGGLDPLEWVILGLPFFGAGHWVPGTVTPSGGPGG